MDGIMTINRSTSEDAGHTRSDCTDPTQAADKPMRRNTTDGVSSTTEVTFHSFMGNWMAWIVVYMKLQIQSNIKNAT